MVLVNDDILENEEEFSVVLTAVDADVINISATASSAAVIVTEDINDSEYLQVFIHSNPCVPPLLFNIPLFKCGSGLFLKVHKNTLLQKCSCSQFLSLIFRC